MKADLQPDAEKQSAVAGHTSGRVTSIAVYLALFLACMTMPLTGHWVLLPNTTSGVYFEYTSIILYWSDLALLLFLSAVVIWWWQARPPAFDRRPALMLPLAMLPLLALLSAASAGDRQLAVTMTLRLLFLCLFSLALWRFRPAPRWVALSLALSMAVQSLVATGQFAVQQDLGWQWLGELDLVPAPGKASVITVGQRLWLRGYGLTPHPNILGGILVASSLVLVTRILDARGWVRLGWLVAMSLSALALVVTFSRAAWFGGLVGGVVLLGAIAGQASWRQRYGRQIIGLLLLGGALLTVLLLVQHDLVMARLTPSVSYTETRSLEERRTLVNLSRELIVSKPILGVGAGNFSLAINPMVTRRAGVTAQPVHNVPYLLAAELGLGGGLIWVILMLAPPWLAFREWKKGRLSLWALGLTAGLVTLAVIDLFDFYSLGWPQGRLLRWMLFGLWDSAVAQPAGPPQSSISSRSSSYQ
jgi:O-antigen ligase